MDGERLRVHGDGAVSLDDLTNTGVRDKPDVSALAARHGKRITILVWHYHDDDLPGADAAVTIDLTGTPGGTPTLIRTLIDDRHSNAHAVWQAMGAPQTPTNEQIRLLEDASRLTPASDATGLTRTSGTAEISFTLVRHGVTLVELQWP
jgi:xylan 1,4-beta-xylosidase